MSEGRLLSKIEEPKLKSFYASSALRWNLEVTFSLVYERFGLVVEDRRMS